MKWNNIKNNYHIKYENYFTIKNNKIVINENDYIIDDLEVFEKSDYTKVNGCDIEENKIATIKIKIIKNKDKKINKTLFSIHDFSNEIPLHCIYTKKDNIVHMYNGEIIRDSMELVKDNDSYYFLLEFKIKFDCI